VIDIVITSINNNISLFAPASLTMAINEQNWALTDETTMKAVDSILARMEKNMSDEDYMRTLRKSPYQRSKASAVCHD
jgi:hypothetical protein